MLNPNTLESEIKKALEQYLPDAFEQAAHCLMPNNSAVADDMCKEFGNTVSEILAEPLASSLAAAIDYYVKNISLQGTIITTGSPVTQTGVIVAAPNPSVAGSIPNTLKIV